MATQVTLNSGAVSSAGSLKLQTNGTTDAVTIDTSGNFAVGTASTKGLISSYTGSASVTLGALANSNFNAVGAGAVGTFAQLCLGAYANTLVYAPAAIGYVATSTAGSNYGDIVFATRNVTTDTAPSERMRIDSSGNLLVGTTTSSAKFTVAGNGYFAGTSGTGGRYLGFSNGTAGQECYVGNYQAIMGVGSSDYALLYSANRVYALASTGGVYVATNGTSWTSASDERLKDIIEPISDASNKVCSLRAVIGKYKSDEEGTRRSFLIAQDVQAVLPEAVDASNPEELGVQYTDVIPLLVAAIQEQQAIIDAQASVLEQLKSRIEALETK